MILTFVATPKKIKTGSIWIDSVRCLSNALATSYVDRFPRNVTLILLERSRRGRLGTIESTLSVAFVGKATSCPLRDVERAPYIILSSTIGVKTITLDTANRSMRVSLGIYDGMLPMS